MFLWAFILRKHPEVDYVCLFFVCAERVFANEKEAAPEHDSAGSHSVHFDRGLLPAGVYHYHMELTSDRDSLHKTGRMVLIQ